jgi:hypothetical protein
MVRETVDGGGGGGLRGDEEVERVVRIAQSYPLFKPSRLERWVCYKQSES